MTAPTTLVPLRPRVPPVSVGAGLTHVGLVRERNEDSILTDPAGALWAVADGMGGHGYGDVASDIVIDSLVQAPDVGDHCAILVNLLQQANTKIHAKALEYGGGTIGSTVTVMIVDRAIGHIAWVGDSRAYLLRSGSLRMLTRDHTVVQELVDQGVIRTDQAKSHIEANVITRAVGSSDSLDVDMIEVPFVAGDRILLCTDGLTACVSDQLIASLLTSADNPDDACKKLVTAALDRGAPDNISVVVVFIVEA